MANRKTSTDHQNDQNPSEQPELAEAEASMTSTTTEDAAIAESAVVRNRVDPDLEGEQEETYDDDGNPVREEPPAEPELLSRDEFIDLMISFHDAPAMFLDPDFSVFSIPEATGHPLQDMRHNGAREVFGRMYDRCAVEHAPKWMRALIRADKEALFAWGSIGVYAFGFVGAAKQYKHIKQSRAAQVQEAANNDAPPEFQSSRTEEAA